MRPLEFKTPGEFSLVQVATDNTLPYIILSHTWIHGQEVELSPPEAAALEVLRVAVKPSLVTY
jgi:hypothetical protein